MGFKHVLSALALTASIAHAQQPSARTSSSAASFDCQRARGKVEKLICADAQAAQLDKRTAELFALASSQASDPGDLKREQRRWLRERDDCDDLACLQSSYELRLRQLATYTGRLPQTMLREMCTRLASPDTRTETLAVEVGSSDINNDGRPETATQCVGGTANVPCVAYMDEDKKPMLIQPQGFDWATDAPLGRDVFRHDDRTFIYYSRDAALTQPSYVSYITPTNREFRVCEFETQIRSAVLEGGHDVCAAVENNDAIETVELASLDPSTIAFGRSDTYARRSGTVDIDNDKLEEHVIELRYESGAGQGCTFNYYELLAEDRRSLASPAKSRPMHELQGLPPEGHYRERNCGNIENRLIKFNEKIYYETNATNNERVPHELRVLDGTAVATLCTFEREVTTRVKRLFGE